MSQVTEQHKLELLRHTLGVGEGGNTPSSRNHFVAGEGSGDCETCRALVAEGLMREHRSSELTGGDPVFVATAQGKAWTQERRTPPPKLTSGQQRYRDYLATDDGRTFGEWLKQQARPRVA